MCDTFGVINNDKAIFAKNSDRSPNESQVIQFIKGHKNKNKTLRVTYIEIEEVKETYSVLLSRPTWMWGAEMGVNEFGVCIGNEAIFTMRNTKKEALTGMDLVRLALERTKSAKEALETIIALLKKYNQGGNCGYDHTFYYDNSFLIMDRKEMYILETSGAIYNYKKVNSYAISNCLTLENKHLRIKESPIHKFFSGSNTRRQLVLNNLRNDVTVLDAFKILRLHHKENIFKKGSVRSVCMHAGQIIGDHTTSSLVVEITENVIQVYFTATSTPCLSLFKTWKFNDKIEYPICTEELDDTYWLEKEKLIRQSIGRKINKEFYRIRNALEEKMLNKKLTLKELLKKEQELNKLLHSTTKEKIKAYYKNYWRKKTKELFEEEIC